MPLVEYCKKTDVCVSYEKVFSMKEKHDQGHN